MIIKTLFYFQMSRNHKISKNITDLPDQAQANIYLQLSRMEDAGMEAFQAVALLQKVSKQNRNYIDQFNKFLQLELTIVEAGVKSRLFRQNDYDLLHMAEVSGNLSGIYKKLATHYALRAKQIKKIKSQCYLPLATLVIAIFINPLPALILSEISIVQYLSACIGLLIKLVMIFYILFRLPNWLTTGRLKFLGLGNLILKIQLKLPLISGLIKAKQINFFVQSLGLLLQAGMPIVQALPKALNTIHNPYLKVQFDPVIYSVNRGKSVANGLSNISVIDSQLVQLILAGENSGRLAESLLHSAEMENQNIDLKQQMLAQWLPKIIYFAVLVWIAFSMTTAQSIPSVPL